MLRRFQASLFIGKKSRYLRKFPMKYFYKFQKNSPILKAFSLENFAPPPCPPKAPPCAPPPPPPPGFVRAAHKFWKKRRFLHQKVRTSVSEDSPSFPFVRKLSALVNPPECGRLLLTAPKQFTRRDGPARQRTCKEEPFCVEVRQTPGKWLIRKKVHNIVM